MNSPEMMSQNINNGQSFYQCLEDPDPYLDTIELSKEIVGVERLLLPGESLLGQDKFVLIDPITKEYQMLHLTNYRLLIDRPVPVSIPYGYIQDIKPLQKFIRIGLKTGLNFDLYLDSSQHLLQEKLAKAPLTIPFCYACVSDCQFPNIYDSYAEIQRMRVDSRHFSVFKNSGLKFCPTYPLYFLVPKGAEVSNLNEVKKCRFYSRIPVLSYYNERTNVGVWRAAKRKQEISEQVRKYDVYYIRSIPGNSIVLQIQENPLVKGNLNFQSLENLRQTFYNVTRQYSQSLQLVTSNKTDLFKTMGKWLDQIDKLISLAYYTVDFINQGHHVVLEETYAFDRVSQVLVLAQIIMDPFFRTFDGLSILIEKEFVSYGHPFEDRFGFSKNKESQISPIFIQLLECICQLVVTHPCCFEYTPMYLARIGYELYTTKYKNFMYRNGDPQKEKQYSRCSMSIWKGLQPKKLRSPHYNKTTKKQLWEIRKKPSIKEYMIWTEYFDMISRMAAEGN